MENYKVAVIGMYIPYIYDRSGYLSEEYVRTLLSEETNFYGRMLFTLGDYLTKYSKKFDGFLYKTIHEPSKIFQNGTIRGMMGMVNRSQIDIGINHHIMNELTTDFVDFAYPFELESSTFVTRKAEYKPHIFAILQTFSLPLWIAIISTLIVMSLVYYVIFKRSYSFDKILLHTFAVLLRQSSFLKPSSAIKHLLIFSWVVGAMFLCLAYDSVVLAFLSFPPINQVKDVPQLAKAVKEGRYHCVANPDTEIPGMLLESQDENLKIIGRDIKTNNLSYKSIVRDFYYDRDNSNVALIRITFDLEVFTTEQKFVSQDRFFAVMVSMPIRKDYCCKKLIDNFVHLMMASGLYSKYKNDRAFVMRLPSLMKHEEKDTSKRVLTLTDVAPAFMFLIFGHTISFLVLIVEILSHRMKKNLKSPKNIARKEDFN